RVAGASIFEYACTVVEHLNKNMGIPTTSDSIGLRIASNKFMSAQFLSYGKVRTIRTLFSQKPVDFGFIASTLSMPLILKTVSGSQSDGVFILSDELAISTSLGVFSKNKINLVLQRYVDSGNPKTDLRVYVVDGKVSAAYKRFALDKDFRSSYTLSKHGEKVEITDEQAQMAIDAAKAIGLGVAGVDIILDSKDNDKPFCVEVNGNGSLLGISVVTGHNVALDIVLYAEKIAKKQKQKEKDTKDNEAANPFEARIQAQHFGDDVPAVQEGMNPKEAMEAVKKKYGF
ncbi:MAG: hypothetical protein Q7V19_13180, partial [Bacteroidales bacterium]|nr:hypothetical protein [Bacteroidales bacterium]